MLGRIVRVFDSLRVQRRHRRQRRALSKAFERFAASAEAVRINLGCGRRPIEGFLNLDGQYSTGADVVVDCAHLDVLPADFVDLAFSHAFLEHLYRHEQEEGRGDRTSGGLSTGERPRPRFIKWSSGITSEHPS